MRTVDDRLELSASDLANHLGCRHLTQLDLVVAKGDLTPPKWRDPTLEVLQQRGLELEQLYLDHLRRSRAAGSAEPGRDDDGSGSSAPSRRCAMAPTSSTRRRCGAVAGMAGPTSCSASSGRASSAPGPTRSWTPSSPARPAPAPSCSSASTRTWSPRSRASCPSGCTSSRPARTCEPEPSAFTTFSPTTGWCSASSRRRSAALASRRHLSRAGAAVRHLPLVAGLRPAAPRRRPPLPRRRHLQAPDQRAPQLGRRHAGGARRAAAAARAQAGARRAGDLRAGPRAGPRPARGAARRRAASTSCCRWSKGRGSAACPSRRRATCSSISRAIPSSAPAGSSTCSAGPPGRPAGPSTTPLGARPGRRAGGVRGFHRPGDGALAALSRSAHLSLRALRARGAQAPDGPLRDARGRARPPAARRALRRSPRGRPPGAPRQRRALLAEGARGLLRLRAGGSAARGLAAPARLRARARAGTTDAIPDETRAAVEAYNRDDCVSTMRLRDWLEAAARRARRRRGTRSRDRSSKPSDPSEALDEHQQRVQALYDRLAGDVPPDPANGPPSSRRAGCSPTCSTGTAARRRRRGGSTSACAALPDEELLEEKAALAGLEFVERVATPKRSVVDRYRFPPQECEIREGDKLHDARRQALRRGRGDRRRGLHHRHQEGAQDRRASIAARSSGTPIVGRRREARGADAARRRGSPSTASTRRDPSAPAGTFCCAARRGLAPRLSPERMTLARRPRLGRWRSITAFCRSRARRAPARPTPARA